MTRTQVNTAKKKESFTEEKIFIKGFTLTER